MSETLLRKVKAFVGTVKGLPCWYVSYGGAAGSTFQLAFGRKVRRDRPLKNPAHPEEYRQHEGEVNLLVWCTWRLDGPDGPLTSSDDTADGIARNLPRLQGAKVRAASVIDQAGDLAVSFWNRLTLRVFCDHVSGDPSFDGNWDLWGLDRALFVGPGSQFEFIERRERDSRTRVAQSRSLAE